jgi:IS605 OrfB family transposase
VPLVQRTIRLRLHPVDAAATPLRETVAAYTESFNRVAAVGWEMRRRNETELHKATYYPEKTESGLPSQLICSARSKAFEAVYSAKKRKAKHCPRSAGQAIRYDARSATIKLAQGTATVATLRGRVKLTFTVPPNHRDKLAWHVASSDLVTDRKGRLWLHVAVDMQVVAPGATGKVIGIDLGVCRPAVTSTNRFLGHRRWREVQARTFRLRRSLQAKGTRSARKKLKRISERLGRFRKDCDHVLSKQLVALCEPGDTLVFEDLTHIRSRIRGRHGQQQRRLHSWSFHRLLECASYKALPAGALVATVDPRNTSRRCSCCGDIHKANRKSQSEFQCKQCGYRLNADLNAARNIRDRHHARGAIRAACGPTVNRPIVPTVRMGNREAQSDTPSMSGTSTAL